MLEYALIWPTCMPAPDGYGNSTRPYHLGFLSKSTFNKNTVPGFLPFQLDALKLAAVILSHHLMILEQQKNPRASLSKRREATWPCAVPLSFTRCKIPRYYQSTYYLERTAIKSLHRTVPAIPPLRLLFQPAVSSVRHDGVTTSSAARRSRIRSFTPSQKRSAQRQMPPSGSFKPSAMISLIADGSFFHILRRCCFLR